MYEPPGTFGRFLCRSRGDNLTAWVFYAIISMRSGILAYHLTRIRGLKQQRQAIQINVIAITLPASGDCRKTRMAISESLVCLTLPNQENENRRRCPARSGQWPGEVTLPARDGNRALEKPGYAQLLRKLNRDRSVSSSETAPGKGLGRFFLADWPLRLPGRQRAAVVCRLTAPGGSGYDGSRYFRRTGDRI